ncbi:MAG: hypothetical protein WBR18_04300 [Anaerolineales bacterium]
MSNPTPGPIIPRPSGLFGQLGQRVKLIVRLLKDSRVSPLVKLLPLGSLIYLLVPDLAPGPLDDAAIIWIGSYLFVELCPPEIVQEHMDELEAVIDGEWRDLDERSDTDAGSPSD